MIISRGYFDPSATEAANFTRYRGRNESEEVVVSSFIRVGNDPPRDTASVAPRTSLIKLLLRFLELERIERNSEPRYEQRTPFNGQTVRIKRVGRFVDF